MEDKIQTSEEAIIIAEPSSQGCGGEIQSTCCQNDCKAEVSSAVTSDSDANKTLELADELVMNGSKLMKEGDYVEATESFSRALEIKVGHYGELAPDSRLLAELNFRVCLCLEIGSKAEEALPYCQKAISICKSRVQRLKDEISKDAGQSSGGTESENVVHHKEAEIETLTSLASDLEKKLEDLQQLVSNPTSVLSEILGLMSAKAKSAEKSSSSAVFSSSRVGTVNTGNGELDSPTISTAHMNGAASASGGVTHLGVIGRGVKRVLMNSGAGAAESGPTKKLSLDNADGSSS